MKRWKLMLATAVVGSIAMGVRAEDKKIKFFGQIEYLTYSDAFEKLEKSNDEGLSLAQANSDYSGISRDKDTASGTGFRIGALAATPMKGVSVGGSLGYIMGPEYNDTVGYTYDDGFDSYTAKEKDENESNLWRLMAEAKYSYPMGEKFQARLGLGLGFANLKVENKYSYEDDSRDSFSENKSISTTKLTWEIGPAIAYVGEKIGVELALTYSQMPSAENMETFQEFDWNPFGVRLGVEF
ncbi:MAG: outer membrane beta-barrel protein [Elusimicrobia bacterium]|nr:outer membrane beta-barrel protein [Elusimicrobiota bacterium]